MEVFHSQTDDVDELFSDLHELHRPGVNLGKGNNGEGREEKGEKFSQLEKKNKIQKCGDG